MKTLRWTHKDADRNYWRISAAPLTIPAEEEHQQWMLTISRQGVNDRWDEVFVQRIVGQYDDPPSLNDCLHAWLADTSTKALGMARYAKPEL